MGPYYAHTNVTYRDGCTEPARWKKGDMTPWGRADEALMIADGIYSFDTPSHGGYWLSDERLQQMVPAAVRQVGGSYCEPRWGNNWFEEDSAWSVVALAFPEEFKQANPWVDYDEAMGTAAAICARHYPAVLQQMGARVTEAREARERLVGEFVQRTGIQPVIEDTAEWWSTLALLIERVKRLEAQGL